MQSIRATVRWCLDHPWAAFWLGAVILFVGAASIPSLALRQLFGLMILAGLAASFVRGARVSWRRSKANAIRNIGIPLAFVLGSATIAILLFRDVERKARLATDQHTMGALREAIATYGRQQGRFPPDKATAEGLVAPRTPWQCPGQDWLYDPAAGWATLARNDAARCR